MTLKKRVMTTLWRVQQAQMVISIVFWSLTLTGVFYPYVRARWLNDLLGPERVAVGMTIMFCAVVALIVAFGLAYDRLKFWREQTLVVQERNPFAYGTRLMPTQAILWEAAITRDPAARFYATSLIEYNMRDPAFKEAYDEILEVVTDEDSLGGEPGAGSRRRSEVE